MAWRTVGGGALVVVVATRLLMARGEGPHASPHSHQHHSVSFAADGLPKRSRRGKTAESALLPAAAAAAAGTTQHGQRQAVSWSQRRWAIEAQLLALQVVLAAVATYTADRLHGRGLAQHVLLASAFLIGGLLVLSLLAAAVSAVWQSLRQAQRPRRGRREAARAAVLAEALLEAGGPTAALAEALPESPVAQDFSGTWDKDKGASDSMEPAMDAVRLNMLVRRGVSLVRGLIIKQDGKDFEMAVFSAVPWFKVVERYPLSGEERQFKRRDLRRGKHVGHAEVLRDGRVRLHVAWGDPVGGVGHDTFSCPAAGVLHVDTVMGIHGRQPLEYRSVYRRRA